eukprot:CAMPEP_0181413938 /NCGR_PEP_ID=MMETSP1110-20121109/9239_1 /TAXON_ID=174948 /ORGANISM="Symbiodinium sp., Strain CCMP421" /LENGTH=97 /DNA_ID=CAMNT_0023536785 /DNA_START=146 /DNA_END=439 /DNA_ORIENTATION=-
MGMLMRRFRSVPPGGPPTTAHSPSATCFVRECGVGKTPIWRASSMIYTPETHAMRQFTGAQRYVQRHDATRGTNSGVHSRKACRKGSNTKQIRAFAL